MPLSLDDAMYLIINYYQIHLDMDYTSFSIECLPPCLRSFFAYYSRFRTTQALLPQNSYYLERNYDWSERLMKEPQNPPPPTFDLVCHDPQLAPIVNTDDQSPTSDSPCHCVHCFIHDAYFLLSVHRCIYVFSPTSTSDLSPFVLSSSEFQSLRDGTLHLRLFNVIFEDGKWSFSPSRYRFYFNSIESLGMTGAEFNKRMITHGISVRDCASFGDRFTSYIRYSVKDRERNCRFIAAADAVING